jgi:hypothetical protein
MIRDREHGGVGPDTESRDDNGDQGESWRSRKTARAVRQVLAQDVPVDAGGIEKNLEHRSKPQSSHRDGIGHQKPALLEYIRHFIAVFRSEGCRIEVQKDPI